MSGTPFSAVVSNIKLMKGKALRKHSLHDKTAASTIILLSIIVVIYQDVSYTVYQHLLHSPIRSNTFFRAQF